MSPPATDAAAVSANPTTDHEAGTDTPADHDAVMTPEQARENLEIAYARVASGGDENLLVKLELTREVVDEIAYLHFERDGFYLTDIEEHDLLQRVDVPGTPKDMAGHIRLCEALLRDYTEPFINYFHQRHEGGGNVILEIYGPTGIGKSSGAVSLAAMFGVCQPEHLVAKHMVFDAYEMPEKMKNLGPGMSVIVDEQIRLTGEGARTITETLKNVADTIRASRVNIIYCSPDPAGFDSTRLALECILWNRKAKKTRCLVWMNGRPKGYVTLPWMPPDLWQVYSAWKDANVDRSLEAAFNDRSFLNRIAVRVLNEERIYRRLKKEPRVETRDLGDIMATENRFGFLTVNQEKMVVRNMMRILSRYESDADVYEVYGERPTKWLRKSAELVKDA